MSGSLRRQAVAAVVLPAFLPACGSISASFESASDSVSTALESVSDSLTSPSGSSSGDEADAKAATQYRTDLCAYTLACLGEEERAGTDAEFVRGIGRIAESHGITHWEGNANTLTAICEAVQAGAVDPAGIARLRRELGMLGPQWIDAALTPATASASCPLPNPPR
jgi:hypothetical protein